MCRLAFQSTHAPSRIPESAVLSSVRTRGSSGTIGRSRDYYTRRAGTNSHSSLIYPGPSIQYETLYRPRLSSIVGFIFGSQSTGSPPKVTSRCAFSAVSDPSQAAGRQQTPFGTLGEGLQPEASFTQSSSDLHVFMFPYSEVKPSYDASLRNLGSFGLLEQSSCAWLSRQRLRGSSIRPSP